MIDTVERQLLDEPLRETRNRKPMRPNPIAPWELRIGTLRVYYDVAEEEALSLIRILAIGLKRGNRVIIGDEEIQL